MKVKELLDLADKKTGKRVNQSMLAKALGITRQSVNNRIRNNSEITISELQKIEDFFKIKLFESKNNDDSVTVMFYPEVFASCGSGTVTFSEEKEPIVIHKSLFYNYSPSKQYSMILAYGDSMSPFINNGDRLIIEHTDNTQIVDNKIYVFCYKSEIFVKRLAKNVDEIVIKSDNPNYNIRTIKEDDINDIRILGQVVGIMRSL